MSARGMFFGEGPTACPFVALENDRDRRSEEPDHRHRCYAEPDPAPRALAHQREYCLAAAFTACPIFQDWAIRAAATPVPLRPGRMQDVEREEQPVWAAPPPWSGPAGELEGTDDEAVPGAADGPQPDYQPPSAGQPHTADESHVAHEPPDGRQGELIPPPVAPGSMDDIERIPSAPTAGQREQEAPIPGFLAGRAEAGYADPDYVEVQPGHFEAQRVQVPRSRAEREAQRDEIIAPWQRGAIEGTRSRVRRPGSGDLLGKLTTLLAVGFILSLAVVAIILAPTLLGGGGGGPGPTQPVAGGPPSPTPPNVRRTPAPTPSPSPRTYTVQAGDTLFAIARRHGLTVEQLMAANPQITNPNLVTIGQTLIIPDDDFGLFTPSPSP